MLGGAHLRRRRHGDVPLPDGVHGHGADHRHRHGRRALEVLGVHHLVVLHGRVHVSALRATGRGAAAGSRPSAATTAWATAMRTSPAPASCTRSAASRRWRWPSSSGRGSASSSATARPTRFRATTSCWCCSAASSWRSAGSGSIPGSTLGAAANGNLRISSVAVNTMLAGMAGSFSGDVLHVDALRQAGRVDDGQRLPRRPGGDHRAERIREPDGVGHHRPHRRRAVSACRASSSSAC